MTQEEIDHIFAAVEAVRKQGLSKNLRHDDILYVGGTMSSIKEIAAIVHEGTAYIKIDETRIMERFDLLEGKLTELAQALSAPTSEEIEKAASDGIPYGITENMGYFVDGFKTGALWALKWRSERE